MIDTFNLERVDFGLVSSVFDLLKFAILLLIFRANEATFQTSWFMISLLTELAVVLVLRTHKPAYRSNPSRLLLWSTIAVASAALTIPFLGSLSSAFGFVPLSAALTTTVIIIIVESIATTEVAKTWFFRRIDS